MKFNSGKWTEARFHSFIMSALRKASLKWPPRSEVKRAAHVSRGYYYCKGYHRPSHVVPSRLDKKENVFVDHITPIGSGSWDSIINRLFCEADNLQVLCKACHDRKTKNENTRRTKTS